MRLCSVRKRADMSFHHLSSLRWLCPPVFTHSCCKSYHKNCSGPPAANLLKINPQTMELRRSSFWPCQFCRLMISFNWKDFLQRYSRSCSHLLTPRHSAKFHYENQWKKKLGHIPHIELPYLLIFRMWENVCFGVFLEKNWVYSHSDLTLVR